MKTPRLYLGTMTFGWTSQTSSKVDESVATEMVRLFAEHQLPQQPKLHLDTARIYAGGATEAIVSHAIQQQLSVSTDPSLLFVVGTKAHPSQPGGLSAAGITWQMEASGRALPHVASFGEYYLHQPDPEHSLLESLQCCHEYYQQGRISAIGMSNYHASEMERAFALCHEHQLTPPTLYQGLYNPLNRMVETELLPVLRKNHCSFVAYNPLAGGLLTAKYQHRHESDDVPPGRFQNNPNYLPRFYTDANFEAVSILQTACTNANIPLVAATYRWLQYHSALDDGDGILIGASSVSQLQQNLEALSNHGPLPDSVVQAFTAAWEVTSRAKVFPYWRSYSSDMPDRDERDPGASYDAVKKPSTR